MLTRRILRRRFGTKLNVNSSNFNWSLSKHLVTPRTTPALNTLEGTGNKDSGLSTLIALETENFPKPLHIATAKSISRGPEIFVEEGEIKGISARIVTNDRNLAEDAKSAINEEIEFSETGITVLLTSDIDFDGKVYYCKEKKLAIGNGFGLDNVVEILNEGGI